VLHPVAFPLLGLYYSGRQLQGSFYFLILLTHYMFRPVRAIFRWMLSCKDILSNGSIKNP
jgi:hypothetical protein